MTQGYRHWTPAEDEYLKANYKTMTKSELAEGTGRSESSVSNRLNKLGLIRDENRQRRWSEDNTEELKALYPEYKAPQIAQRMGWSANTIYRKIDELGLRKRGKREEYQEWTEEDDLYVMNHFDTMDRKEIADHLGRTPKAVYQRYRVLKINGGEVMKRAKRTGEEVWIPDLKIIQQIEEKHGSMSNCPVDDPLLIKLHRKMGMER